MYKGLDTAQSAGYFIKEFDNWAPLPGMDWDGEPDKWLANASEKGWVVKTSPRDGIPGALILGLDKSNNIWLGIVRQVEGDISFETLDDSGKLLQNVADEKSLKATYNFIGYIWPQRVQGGVRQISVEKALVDWRSNTVLIVDVRTVDEYKQGHVPGAVSIPLDDLEKRLGEIPKERKVLLICRTGKRSYKAGIILQNNGYSNIWNVTGGMVNWRWEIEK